MRTKETYYDNLEQLKTAFPGKAMISLRQAAQYLSVDARTLLASDEFPKTKIGKQTKVGLVNLARWMAV